MGEEAQVTLDAIDGNDDDYDFNQDVDDNDDDDCSYDVDDNDDDDDCSYDDDDDDVVSFALLIQSW